MVWKLLDCFLLVQRRMIALSVDMSPTPRNQMTSWSNLSFLVPYPSDLSSDKIKKLFFIPRDVTELVLQFPHIRKLKISNWLITLLLLSRSLLGPLAQYLLWIARYRKHMLLLGWDGKAIVGSWYDIASRSMGVRARGFSCAWFYHFLNGFCSRWGFMIRVLSK